MINVLIVAATETELKAFLPPEFEHGKVGLVSAVLGVGKMASIKLRYVLERYKFDLVLIVGSCGSKDFSSGTVISPSCFFDSDGMSKVDIKRNVSSFMPIRDVDDLFVQNVISVEVTCFSSKFSCPQNIQNLSGIVYDMESYSIAELCFKKEVALNVLKIVVDGREKEFESLSEYLQYEVALYKEKTYELWELMRGRIFPILT